MDADDSLAFLRATNRNEAEEVLGEVVRLGLDFKLRDSILKTASYDSLYELICEPLPEHGRGILEVISEVAEKIIPYSTNFSAEMAMAFPDAGNSLAGISGAILSILLNQNLINWTPCAPAATVVEVAVLLWFRELLGFAVPAMRPVKPVDIGGFITSGGVGSNTVALLVAREYLIPNAMRAGLSGAGSQLYVIVPDGIDHYSSRLAAGWLGVGEHAVRKVPTRNFKYDLDALGQMMTTISAHSNSRIVVVAYAGDSRTMTCDDFASIRALCDKHLAWLHIDACHGTQLLFSAKLRARIAGIELADSVTFDPHKVFNVPYVLSLVLFKNPSVLEPLRRPEDIITGEPHSFGQITPLFGSRPFSALKLYMLIKNLGRGGMSKLIEERHAHALELAAMIRNDDEFLLLNDEININSVAFMYWPQAARSPGQIDSDDIAYYNSLNAKIQKDLFDRGVIWLHNFSLPDSANSLGCGKEALLRPLRFMSGNPNITTESLRIMMTEVRRTGRQLHKES